MKTLILTICLLSFTQAYSLNKDLKNGLYSCNEERNPEVSFELTDKEVILTLKPFEGIRYQFSNNWQQSPRSGMYQARRFEQLVLIKHDIDDSQVPGGDITFGHVTLRKTAHWIKFKWVTKVIATKNDTQENESSFSGICKLKN